MSALNCLLCDQKLRKNTKISDDDENDQVEKKYIGPEIGVSVLCDSLQLAPTLFTQKEHCSFKAPLCSDCNDKIIQLQKLLKDLQRIEKNVARLRKKIKAQLTRILDNPKDDDDSEGIRLKIFTDLAKVSLGVSEVENETVIVKSEPISDDSAQEDNTDGFVPDDVDSFGPTVKVETENNFPKDTLTHKDSKKSKLSAIKKRSRKISKKKPTDVKKRLKLPATNEDEGESNQTLANLNTSKITRSGRLIRSTARPEFLYKEKIIVQEPNSVDETGVDADRSFSGDKSDHEDEIIDKQEQDQDSNLNHNVNRLSTKRQKKLSKEDCKKKNAEHEYKHIIDPNLTLEQIKLIGCNKTPLKSEDYLVADDTNGKPSINMSMSRIIKDESVAVVKVNEQLYGRRYSCSYEGCNKTFTDKETRDVHYKKRHENNLFPYECEKCQKSFRQKRTLIKHVESLCQENEEVKKWPKRKKPQVKCKNHQCPHCPEKYRGPNELQIHIRKMHTGETPYKCQYCDQSFISALKLEFHVERNHQEVTPIKCEYCGKGFFREHRLKNHIVVHTGEKPFLCEICCRAFPLKNQLTFHQAIHDEQMAHKFRCEKCNKNFASTQILKQHVAAVHDKLYKYICEICDHGTAQSSAHRIHMRTHTGEKPFKCEHCDKAFITGSRLTIHLRTHTGERPFVCTICEAAFMTSSRLHRHELIHKKKAIPVEMDYDPIHTVQLEEMPIVFVESITFS